MKDVYDKLDSMTRKIHGYAIQAKDGAVIARFVTKTSESNASVTGFLHFWGHRMVSARVSGHGFDRVNELFHDLMVKALSENEGLAAKLASHKAVYNRDEQWQTCLKDIQITCIV